MLKHGCSSMLLESASAFQNGGYKYSRQSDYTQITYLSSICCQTFEWVVICLRNQYEQYEDYPLFRL